MARHHLAGNAIAIIIILIVSIVIISMNNSSFPSYAEKERSHSHQSEHVFAQNAAAVNPNDENALYSKGVSLYNLGNYTEAIKYFDRALAIRPNDTYALSHKGEAFDNLGKYTGAILYYDKALAIQPNDTYALSHKGVALSNLRNDTGAILYYDKALAIDPKNEHALYSKGVSLYKLRNYTGAMGYFDKLYRAIDPYDENVLYSKGVSLHNQENYMGPSTSTMIFDPFHDKLYSKGVSLYNLGNYTEAIKYFDRALALDPSFNYGNGIAGNGNGYGNGLQSPIFEYTGYDKATSFKPAIVNGKHGIQISFTGHGAFYGIEGWNITDNGTAFVTNSTMDDGAIYTTGRRELVSSMSSYPKETVAFTFQGIGYYGTDGKLRDTGTILSTKANGILVSGTLSGELRNTLGMYKDEIDKAGNAITKIWYWK